MYKFGDYIPNAAMAAASMWIVRRFLGTFCEKKERSFLSVSAWILYFVFQIYFQIDTGNPHVITLPLSVALLFNIALWGYCSTGKEKCFLSVMLCALWLLMEMFTFVMVSGIQMEHESLDVLGTIISKILMIVLVYTVSVFWNKRYDEIVSGHFYFYFLFLPGGSIFIALNLFYSQGSRFLSTISVSILLLFNVVVFEIYMKMNELFMQEKERIIYAKQAEIISANTEEQKKMIEDFHEEKHNLVNQLIVLKSEVENCETEEVIRNLNEIIKNCHYTDSISECGNTTIDAIINFKYTMAREWGIDFRLKIFVPQDLPVEQRALGVVLGNALDNAMEAVRGSSIEDKVIDISMGTKKSALILVMKNPYEHVIQKDRRGTLLSSKDDKGRHGYGLKSIMKIAAKYQGDVVIEDAGNVFSLTVVMNFG